MAKEAYQPPPDPDFKQLAETAQAAFLRDRPSLVAFDTETHGVSYWDEAFCATVAWKRPHPRKVTIGTGPGPKNVMLDTEQGGTNVVTYSTYKQMKAKAGEIESHFVELDLYDGKPILRELLRVPTLVGHNLGFDLQKAALLKTLRPRDTYILHDTQGLAHLDDEHREAGLKKLMVSVLDWQDVIEVEYKSGPKKGTTRPVPREKHEMEVVRRKLGLTVSDPWSLLPRAIILPYAIKDAEATLELYTKLRPQVERYDDLWALYQQEMELLLVLYDMAAAGLRLDLPYVEAKIKEYGKRVAHHELAIEEIVGKPVRSGKIPPKEKDLFFNPNSNPQLREYFEARGFERESYDEANLKEIDDPLARALPALRGDSKVLNTYFVAMKREQRDGILHPNFRQHGTVTGRMSSGKQEG